MTPTEFVMCAAVWTLIPASGVIAFGAVFDRKVRDIWAD